MRLAATSVSEIRRLLSSRGMDDGVPAWHHATPQPAPIADAPPPDPGRWTLDGLRDAYATGSPPAGDCLAAIIDQIAADAADADGQRTMWTGFELLSDLGLADGYSPWLVANSLSTCILRPDADGNPQPVTCCNKTLSGRVRSLRDELDRARRRHGAHWLTHLRLSSIHGPTASVCPTCQRAVNARPDAWPADIRSDNRALWAGLAGLSQVRDAIREAITQAITAACDAATFEPEQIDDAADDAALHARGRLLTDIWEQNPARSLRLALGSDYARVRRHLYGRAGALLGADRKLDKLAAATGLWRALFADPKLFASDFRVRRLLVAQVLQDAHGTGL